MAGQTYDPYAVFADAPAPTPDLSQIPTAQLQALLDARRASEAAGSASGAVQGKAGLFDDLIPSAPATAGNSPRFVPVDGDPFAANGVSSQPQAVPSGNVFDQFDTPATPVQAAPQGQPSANYFDRFDPPASSTPASPAPTSAAADPWAAFPDAPASPSPTPNGARSLTIRGPGNLQASPGSVAGQTDPNAQGAPVGAPVRRAPQLVPVDGDPFAAGGTQPQQGFFDDLIPQQQQDPGFLQHLANAASRVPGNLLGKLQAINPHDINQTVDSLAAGLPFSDRISAAAAAATGIGGQFGDYAGNLAADRAATAARMQADPSREMVGQFVGGAMLPVGAANKALQGATLGTRLTRGAMAGASIGAVQGASSSADLGNIPQAALSTAIGAGTGAGFGLAAPLVGAGAGAAARRLLGQTVPTVAGPSGPIAAPAQKYLMDAIQADGAGAIWQGTQQLGDHGMLADFGNNLRGIAQGLAIKPGAAGQYVVQALEARNAGVNTRLGQSVGQNLGPVTSPLTHGAAVDAAVQPYAIAQRQALQNAGPIDISAAYKGIQDAIPNAAPGSPEHTALAKALTMLSERPMPAASSGFVHDPLGPSTLPEMPNLPEPPPYSDTAAPSRPAPVGVPRPQDLHGFIRSAGGMQDPGGDLASMGLGHLMAKPGQGIGPDAMRQAAAQAGYLGANVDHAMANTNVNDLLNAIGSDSPVHSIFDQDAVHAWNERDAAMQAYQQAAGADPLARGAGPRSAPGLPFGGPDVATAAGPSVVPTTNAMRIDSARKTLDEELYPTVPGGQVSSAVRDELGAHASTRRALSDALKAQIPAYRDAIAKTAEIAPMRGAYAEGLDDLTRDVAHYPPDYRQTFDGLAPQVQDSRAAGLRMAVEQAVGTKENDLQALRNATQGANGWNSQNLGHVFGQGPVDNVNQDIAAELRMRDTYGKVTQNAETARRTAMAKALADAEHEPFQIGHVHNLTAEGMVATPLKMAANAVLRAFQPAVDNGARDMQIGQAITAQGDPRNQIMAQLLRAHAVRKANDALGAPVDRAATTLTALSPAALAHALRNYREPAR